MYKVLAAVDRMKVEATDVTVCRGTGSFLDHESPGCSPDGSDTCPTKFSCEKCFDDPVAAKKRHLPTEVDEKRREYHGSQAREVVEGVQRGQGG